MRPSTDMQSLGALKAVLRADGRDGRLRCGGDRGASRSRVVNHVHHAGNSSGIVDGAAAVLVGIEEGPARRGLKPRARIRAFAIIGSDLALMLTGPVDVIRMALKKAGMTTDDIDLFEINEAFSAVVLRYMQAMKLDPRQGQREWRRHRAWAIRSVRRAR